MSDRRVFIAAAQLSTPPSICGTSLSRAPRRCSAARITRPSANPAREGVTFLHDIDPRGTERHVNLKSDDGGRISIYMAHATLEPRVALERLEPVIADSGHVVININNYCRRLIPVAKRRR